MPLSPSFSYSVLGFLVAYFLYGKISLYLVRRKFIRENDCKPPPPLPQSERILGLGILLENARNSREKRFLRAIYERFNRMGVTTFTASVAGESFISTIEPENIKHVLALQFKDFDIGYKRHRAFYPLLGNGIFTTDGALWEHSRAIVRPNFTRNQLADLDTFETHIKHLIAHVPKDGSTVDLQELFFRLTLDSATEFLFGHSVGSLVPGGSSEGRSFAEAFNYSQWALTQRVRLGKLWFTYRDKKFTQSCKVVHEFADRFVQRALEYRKSLDPEKALGSKDETRERYIFLNELAKQTDNPKEIRDQLLNILLAGRDTTASLLSNTFNVISKMPDVWSKLREEVSKLEGRRPSYEELRNMKYVKYVLNECTLPREIFRKYPKANQDLQPSVSCQPCQAILVWPTKTQLCLLVGVQTANRRSSSRETRSLSTVSGPCTAERTYTVMMPRNSALRDGRP
jgi:cytochrome P450